MAQVTRSISLPEEIMEALDQVAKKWFTDRSKAIVRIFQEWEACQPAPHPAPEKAEVR
jgi:metal-responsive CopG/Arc/MetJ family transcriptional regulator